MKQAVIIATFDVGDHVEVEPFVQIVQDILMSFNEEVGMKDVIQLRSCRGSVADDEKRK